MKAKKIFQTVETHTLGQPTRNVVSGFPHIPGKTMTEKFFYMKEHMDWFRTLLACEPRSNDDMSCTLLTEPCTPNTDVGVLYFESAGWLPMCGHDTIGVAVCLIETGMVSVSEPQTTIRLDTAAGVITVEANVENGIVKEVSFINAPAFVLSENLIVNTKNFGPLVINVAWGGNLYAILPSNSIGIPIEKQNSSKLVEAAQSIAKDINEQNDFRHPDLNFISKVTHIEFYGAAKSTTADIQNCVIALPKTLDRSPCGTGTSAKAAVLHRQGKLNVGDSFVHESIIGSLFKCEIIKETTVSGFTAVVPKITGNAYISGVSSWILDPEDPFPKGFLLV